MELTEKWESTEEIFSGAILKVNRDKVKLPNGKYATREVVRHVGAVCVVPLLDDGRVIMERQFRYPVGEVVYEIPAGKLDSEKEAPELAARRELEEETGYTAEKMIYLGQFYPAAAYTDERLDMFVATELTAGKAHLDEDEFVNVEAVPLEEVVKDVVEGKIPDAKTQAAIMRVLYMKEHGLL